MDFIQIHKKDNAAVALRDLPEGFSCGGILLKEPIPAGHKFALRALAAGEEIIKYGFPIGSAKTEISAGSHLHTHNVRSGLGDLLQYEYRPDWKEFAPVAPPSFKGYRRENGGVGIRNEVWIVPTVGCVNATVRELERLAEPLKNQNIDGIYAYNHPYGCSQLGDDQQRTLQFLAGLIRHPNAGAVLVVGLGCENGNIEELKKVLGDYDARRVAFLVCQEEEDELAAGAALLEQLCGYAGRFEREDCPVSELVIGLKCGGSDGFSGLTANPLLGQFSDRLIACGGSTILTEVPEMFGAETILMNRCRSERQFEQTVALINDFKQYFLRYGEGIDENPSPGNKAGGITTLEDKALGCTQKGGSAPVEDVLRYGEPVQKKGLSLLQSPGNDPVAANALVASGAQMVLFTTGRGTPFSCPVPTVKISSNTALYEKKKNWIDFNAGALLEGVSMAELSDAFFAKILAIASGEEQTGSERQDKHELAIFKDGVTL